MKEEVFHTVRWLIVCALLGFGMWQCTVVTEAKYEARTSVYE